jgi:glycosyltransferase involved in cell wall biosynthesis
MKIGFFTDSYLPVIHGVTISIEAFRKNLEKRGHEVFIYAPSAPGYEDKIQRIHRFKSIKAIKKPEMRFGFPVVQNDSLKEVINSKLDIIHAHTPFSMGLMGKFISDRQKIPLIYTHHTDYPEYAKSYLLKEKLVTPYMAKLYCSWFANLSNAVIAPSLKIVDILRDSGVKREIHVLATGIDVESFRISEASKQAAIDLRKHFNISPDEKILIFVGRMGREKNVEFLLNAFQKIYEKKNNVKFVLLGDGPHLAKLKTLAKKIDLNSVIFAGNIPHEKIPIYYQAANLFVFASLTDTQGIVALEAMASGLPVVALQDDALKNIVIDNENGFFVKPGETEEFAQSVINIFDDNNLYQKFSHQAKLTVKDYSQENQTEKLLDVYMSTLSLYNKID